MNQTFDLPTLIFILVCLLLAAVFLVGLLLGTNWGESASVVDAEGDLDARLEHIEELLQARPLAATLGERVSPAAEPAAPQTPSPEPKA